MAYGPVKHVLVVDDEPDLRTIVGQVLREVGYAVATAANGVEALERLRQHRPDGVVLDLSMPLMDGLSFLRVCRADPAYAELPVVVCTTEAVNRPVLATLGVRTCIPKPFDLDELLQTVGRLVDHAADLTRATERPERTAPVGSWRTPAQLDHAWAPARLWATAAARARQQDLVCEKLAHTRRVALAADACLTRAQARVERSRLLLAAAPSGARPTW
jgi:two-component system, chemotaxis family, chemotaxis protein CheY